YVHNDGCNGKIHMHCNQCDKTFHMKDTGSRVIVDNISQNDDFIIDKVATVLYGTCKKCKKIMEK
ncbi:MAG: transcriptional repressor, partial [Clostridia bacterium]